MQGTLEFLYTNTEISRSKATAVWRKTGQRYDIRDIVITGNLCSSRRVFLNRRCLWQSYYFAVRFARSERVGKLTFRLCSKKHLELMPFNNFQKTSLTHTFTDAFMEAKSCIQVVVTLFNDRSRAVNVCSCCGLRTSSRTSRGIVRRNKAYFYDNSTNSRALIG